MSVNVLDLTQTLDEEIVSVRALLFDSEEEKTFCLTAGILKSQNYETISTALAKENVNLDDVRAMYIEDLNGAGFAVARRRRQVDGQRTIFCQIDW